MKIQSLRQSKAINEMLDKKYGSLTVVGLKFNGKRTLIITICECGSRTLKDPSMVRRGLVRSCGRRECKHWKHRGVTSNLLYRKWNALMKRCFSQDYENFHRYGGRGIGVSEEWLDPRKFIRDMQESYLKHVKEYGDRNTTLERIDVNKGYSKDNCTWATIIEQQNNKSNNVFLVIDGDRKTISQWARHNNISPSTAFARIRMGWAQIEAVTEPLRR